MSVPADKHWSKWLELTVGFGLFVFIVLLITLLLFLLVIVGTFCFVTSGDVPGLVSCCRRFNGKLSAARLGDRSARRRAAQAHARRTGIAALERALTPLPPRLRRPRGGRQAPPPLRGRA